MTIIAIPLRKSKKEDRNVILIFKYVLCKLLIHLLSTVILLLLKKMTAKLNKNIQFPNYIIFFYTLETLSYD